MTERAIGSSSECRKSDHPIIILDNHNEKMHMYQSGNLFHVVLMRFLERKKKPWAPFLAKNCRSINQACVWSLHRLQRCESVKSQIRLHICIFGWRENFWSKRERAFEILRNPELAIKGRKRIRGWFCCFDFREVGETKKRSAPLWYFTDSGEYPLLFGWLEIFYKVQTNEISAYGSLSAGRKKMQILS